MYMHLSRRFKELKRDTNSKDHAVTNIWNLRRGIRKELLSMFLVELKAAADNKDIYMI
jgi:hypothetical protein